MDCGSGSIRSACRTRKVQQVDKLHFSDETDVHVLSEIYEDLLKHVAADSAGYAGEFYTQRHIIRAMVEVVHPKPGDRVYDPSFGTAGCPSWRIFKPSSEIPSVNRQTRGQRQHLIVSG